MQREIETPLGRLRVTLHRGELSHPNRQVMIAVVEDLHNKEGHEEVAPVVVNGIPLRFTEWFQAELTDDLSQDSSWRNTSGSVTRLDQTGYNDATDNQKSKVWRAAREAVTGLFSDPEFVFEVVLADQKAAVETKRKAVEKAEADLHFAQAELSAWETVAAQMEEMVAPFEGDDLADRMVFDDERHRIFRLGTYAEPQE